MSKEEKKQLYKDFKNSGMSITDYCKANNVSAPVIRGLQIYYENKLSNDEFVSVKTVNENIIAESEDSFVEFYINNLKFKVHQTNLSKLMKGLFL